MLRKMFSNHINFLIQNKKKYLITEKTVNNILSPTIFLRQSLNLSHYLQTTRNFFLKILYKLLLKL